MNTTAITTNATKAENIRQACQQIAHVHNLSVFNSTVAERQRITLTQYPCDPTYLLTQNRLLKLHTTLLEQHGVGLLTALGHVTIEEAQTMICHFWQKIINDTNNTLIDLHHKNVIHYEELPYLYLTPWCLPKGCRREFSKLTGAISSEVFVTLWNGIVDLHRSRTFI